MLILTTDVLQGIGIENTCSKFRFASWSLNAPFFNLKISKKRTFWLKKAYFGAFKLTKSIAFILGANFLLHHKIQIVTNPKLFSKIFYNTQNRIYSIFKFNHIFEKKLIFFFDFSKFLKNANFHLKISFLINFHFQLQQ